MGNDKTKNKQEVQNSMIELSIVIPVHNEEQNILPLYQECLEVMREEEIRSWQIIFVNDGSYDGTKTVLRNLFEQDPEHVVIINFRKRYGQTTAFREGFRHAESDIIASSDGDLQTDLHDLPELLEEAHSGFDVVCGWRKNRQDTFVKKWGSRFANKLRRLFLQCAPVHDTGCHLRVYQKEAIKSIVPLLSGQLHRFIPDLLALKGWKIGEIVVNHRPRTKGFTKYTWKSLRWLFGFCDLLRVRYWKHDSFYFFGSVGILFVLVGLLLDAWLVWKHVFFGTPIGQHPLLSFGATAVLVGVVVFFFGLTSTKEQSQPVDLEVLKKS